ncbi:hypothetical protein HAX54_045197 [Datura stramonium]|uniref:Uncharacterized protein n=1 Tax=Datura stramonium TaxID=4076 RepID=A0ABS8SRW6_DATST|nr:hypothetical protein [Datura stramonium]
MESKSNKGKEIEAAGKGLKQLRKCTKGPSSSSSKGATARMLRERAVEPHGLSWFNTQKEVKYAPKNWIDKGFLALEFSTIQDKVRELGLGYIFAKTEKCNLTLVRNFMQTRTLIFGRAPKSKYGVRSWHSAIPHGSSSMICYVSFVIVSIDDGVNRGEPLVDIKHQRDDLLVGVTGCGQESWLIAESSSPVTMAHATSHKRL